LIVKLFSIKDKLVGFNPPIGFKDEKVAERWFESECRRKMELEYTSPKYYEFYEIGTMDTDTGLISAYPTGNLKLIKEGEQYERQ
jgi:hypothetical protein